MLYAVCCTPETRAAHSARDLRRHKSGPREAHGHPRELPARLRPSHALRASLQVLTIQLPYLLSANSHFPHSHKSLTSISFLSILSILLFLSPAHLYYFYSSLLVLQVLIYLNPKGSELWLFGSTSNVFGSTIFCKQNSRKISLTLSPNLSSHKFETKVLEYRSKHRFRILKLCTHSCFRPETAEGKLP